MAKRGRIPKPWPRKSTGTWYVTLDGKMREAAEKASIRPATPETPTTASQPPRKRKRT
ncbi:MAG: hypothetical protein U0790_25175 [Isosphaeraceae bacterium]